MRAWERQLGESAKAYAAWTVYRDLGPERSLRKTAQMYYGCIKNVHQLARWSRKFDWVERARAFDDYHEMIRREAIETHQRSRLQVFAARERKVQEELLEVKELYLAKLKTMAAWPLEKRIVKEGENEIHIYPARWSFSTLNRGIEVLDDSPEKIDLRTIDLSQLTDEQLERIANGEDPRKVLSDFS
jgi:hypothetical protein